MIGGAGYMAGKKAVRGQQREQDQEERLAALEQQQGAPQAPAAPAPAAPAPAAAAPSTDVVGELTKLKGLLDAGVLTPEEFEQAKARVLGS
ncbi:MAG TPA: SHOCT domain-containing protein [Capillimicrobium sp.]|nr:SHOCT domain-containing protein [Capillimicrobium sp.]